MANIPALAGYQTANGEAAPAKFGGSDVLTDPNGNVLLTAVGGAGSIVPFDTPVIVMAYNNTLYSGATTGSPWNYSSQHAFNGVIDLSGLTPAIPSGAKAVILVTLANLYNTVGGAARVINMYAAKLHASLPTAAQYVMSSAYHVGGVAAGAEGVEYDANPGYGIVNFNGDRTVAIAAYSNNSPNNAYWYWNVAGYTI